MLETTGAMPFNMPMFSIAEMDALRSSLIPMSSLAGSPVRTSHRRENAPVFVKANALVYGGKCGALLAKFDPAQSCLRMLTQSYIEDAVELMLLQNLPLWGMWDGSGLYQLLMPERHIYAIAGSAWLTPTAQEKQKSVPDSASLVITKNNTIRRRNKAGTTSLLNLSIQVKWATPTAVSHKGTGRFGSKSHQWDVSHFNLKGQVVNSPSDDIYLNPDWVEMLMGYPAGWTKLCSTSFPRRQVNSLKTNPAEPRAQGLRKDLRRSAMR